MFPVLCRIGPVPVYSYGLMLAVAIIVCTFLLSRDFKAAGLPSEDAYDLVFWTALFGLLGARIFYIFLNFWFFLQSPLEIIMIQKGGLAWQGGLILGAAAGVWFVKRKRMAMGQTLNLCAPYIALGQSIGRLGCFFNGCCYGKEVSWGIYFPVHAAHLHPTQLYSSLGLFVVFLVLKQFQKMSPRPGEVFILYVLLASSLRFVVEFFRADHELLWAGLSIFQLVCLVLFLTAGFYFLRSKKL